MDAANREEAVRCLSFARSALARGDAKRARKLANKSIRLCDTQEAQAFLRELSERGTKESERTPPPSDEGGGEGVRRRRREESREDQSSSESEDYTSEQREAVDRLLRCKDYYEILGVSRDVPESDLKRQYRRLALQFHPDKNRAPRADEAFKAISNAYAILSDHEKREQYDRYGEDGLHPQRRMSNQFTRGFESDISPDDLFRMFFGDSFNMGRDAFYYSNGPGAQYYVYRPHNGHRHTRGMHTHAHHAQEGSGPLLQLCQFLPIIILLLLSVFSNVLFSLLQPTPPFSLTRTSEYNIKRVTSQHDIPYYVQKSFSEEYETLSDVLQVEKLVLSDYKWGLKINCENDRYRQAFYRSKKSKTPDSCKKLQKLEKLPKG